MIVSVDIPYKVLKEAVQRIEKKMGVCENLPSARFMVHQDDLPRLSIFSTDIPYQPAYSWFVETLVCDQMGGKSTGCSAEHCKNCILKVGSSSSTIKEEQKE